MVFYSIHSDFAVFKIYLKIVFLFNTDPRSHLDASQYQKDELSHLNQK